MRLLIDMNLTPRWVPHLRNAEHETVRWSSVGSNSAKDSEICDYPRQYAYVLLTNDLDFRQILAHTKQAAPSIVLLRGEPLEPEARGSALLLALKIVTLDWSDKPRARVLPLR
jgi:predicted nuclease of predicted toxin-antitoxin system